MKMLPGIGKMSATGAVLVAVGWISTENELPMSIITLAVAASVSSLMLFGSSISIRSKAALVLGFIPIFQHSTDYYYWHLVRETGWPWPWAANGSIGSIAESMGQVADVSSVLVIILAGLIFGKSLARPTAGMPRRDSR